MANPEITNRTKLAVIADNYISWITRNRIIAFDSAESEKKSPETVVFMHSRRNHKGIITTVTLPELTFPLTVKPKTIFHVYKLNPDKKSYSLTQRIRGESLPKAPTL